MFTTKPVNGNLKNAAIFSGPVAFTCSPDWQITASQEKVLLSN